MPITSAIISQSGPTDNSGKYSLPQKPYKQAKQVTIVNKITIGVYFFTGIVKTENVPAALLVSWKA